MDPAPGEMRVYDIGYCALMDEVVKAVAFVWKHDEVKATVDQKIMDDLKMTDQIRLMLDAMAAYNGGEPLVHQAQVTGRRHEVDFRDFADVETPRSPLGEVLGSQQS